MAKSILDREAIYKIIFSTRHDINLFEICNNNCMTFSVVNYRAMLTTVTTIVCLICYCCHRKIKMRSSTSSLYRQQRWLENDPSMEIYSVEQVSFNRYT